MLFKWLKRRSEPAPASKPRRPAPGSSSRSSGSRPAPPSFEPTEPAGLPEVVGEGNTHADWSAWEDSVAALDSQLPGASAHDRIRVRDTTPSQLEEQDPFEAVRLKQRGKQK